MTDTHDLHVLDGLIAAIRSTPGAPSTAIEELDAQRRRIDAGEAAGDGASVVEAARGALGGLIGAGRATAVQDQTDDDDVERLGALMARMDAAMADDRLSGPTRDAVIRAFDPIKAARDAALQRRPD